ncbi:MAG TPA: Ig-like domain-containing protein [Polyangiaceae bacterium]|nr:Ig-like domain-containing protein [Polyangiaceae bacterium]
MRPKLRAVARAGVATLALTLGVVACTDVFSNGDCSSSRTCEAAGGQSSDGGAGGAGGDDVASAGADGVTAGGVTAGGAGGAGGDGPTRGDECEVPKDCTNGDAQDGEEGCDNGYCIAGNPPPTVVSVSPEDDAVDVEPSTEIVIEFSEPVDPKTVTSANIQLLDGDEPVAGELSYDDGKAVFKPQYPLGLLAHYEVSVSTAVTDAEGTPLLEAFSSTLAVRDGAWTVKSVVTEPIATLSDTLPVTAAGHVLLAWVRVSSPTNVCPTRAQWFSGVESLDTATSLTSDTGKACSLAHASVGPAGDGLVIWHETNGAGWGASAVQYNAGAWLPKTPVSGTKVPGFAVSAVGTDGVSHHLESNPAEPAVRAFVTDANGTWSTASFTLSGESATRPQLAVAKGGRAVAAWCANDSVNGRQKIAFASYAPEKHAWGKGITLPGSQAASAGAGYERSTPNVALSEQGDAMVVWVAEQKVMASRLPAGSAQWSEPVSLSGGLQVLSTGSAPALVFDGKTFIAAWTTVAGITHDVNVARYDMNDDTWGAYQTLGDKNSRITQRMPQLGSDMHQNLFLVWPTALKVVNLFRLSAQRFVASMGTWGPPEDFSSATDPGLADETSPLPFSMNQAGIAALAWGTADTVNGGYTKLSLASFR